jgi:glycosyltransferase involved in cell wall biosynthesis
MVTIVHLITGLETGGAERMLSRLVARTDRDRFRSLVVTITGAGNMAAAVDRAGIELISLGIRRGTPDPRGLFRLHRILREVQPDILQTWLYHADFLGLVVKQLGYTPHLIWNVRCSDMSLASVSAVGGSLRRLLSWCSATPDAVIVNSRAGRRFHERIGYRPRRWEHVPNGFDTDELRPNLEARRHLRAELGIDDETIMIGLPARYHPMKDHSTFLEAAATLAAARPGICFVLLGPGIEPSNRSLVKAIGKRGLSDRIRLLGERNDMAEVYAALDIATLSSACGEGFPNVLGEAMACGLPCVATDIGDASELLGQTGIVVPPRDPHALAVAWRVLIEIGAQRRRSLGSKARVRIVQDYSLGAAVARYEALYDDIVAQSVASRDGRASPAALPSSEHRSAVSRR